MTQRNPEDDLFDPPPGERPDTEHELGAEPLTDRQEPYLDAEHIGETYDEVADTEQIAEAPPKKSGLFSTGNIIAFALVAGAVGFVGLQMSKRGGEQPVPDSGDGIVFQDDAVVQDAAAFDDLPEPVDPSLDSPDGSLYDIEDSAEQTAMDDPAEPVAVEQGYDVADGSTTPGGFSNSLGGDSVSSSPAPVAVVASAAPASERPVAVERPSAASAATTPPTRTANVSASAPVSELADIKSSISKLQSSVNTLSTRVASVDNRTKSIETGLAEVKRSVAESGRGMSELLIRVREEFQKALTEVRGTQTVARREPPVQRSHSLQPASAVGGSESAEQVYVGFEDSPDKAIIEARAGAEPAPYGDDVRVVSLRDDRPALSAAIAAAADIGRPVAAAGGPAPFVTIDELEQPLARAEPAPYDINSDTHRFHVAGMSPNRAWVVDQNQPGMVLPLQVGDVLPGYGHVNAIDQDRCLLSTSSGGVIRCRIES